MNCYILEWRHEQLAQMLSERLKACSNRRVVSLQQIAQAALPVSLDEPVAICAQGSPRNVVRICKEIFDQPSEIDAKSPKLSKQAIDLGFQKIAENLSHELFTDAVIRDLQKTRRCDFTIRYIYSDVFKFTRQAALNKVHMGGPRRSYSSWNDPDNDWCEAG